MWHAWQTLAYNASPLFSANLKPVLSVGSAEPGAAPSVADRPGGVGGTTDNSTASATAANAPGKSDLDMERIGSP
jgi:hypothetical protein